SYAQEMPHGIFYVIGIYCLMQLKLLSAFLKTVGIIVSNASLPMVRSCCRPQRNEPIKISYCFINMTQLEMLQPAILPCFSQARVQFQSLIKIVNCFLRLVSHGQNA